MHQMIARMEPQADASAGKRGCCRFRRQHRAPGGNPGVQLGNLGVEPAPDGRADTVGAGEGAARHSGASGRNRLDAAIGFLDVHHLEAGRYRDAGRRGGGLAQHGVQVRPVEGEIGRAVALLGLLAQRVGRQRLAAHPVANIDAGRLAGAFA
jgi:hypothetical protein